MLILTLGAICGFISVACGAFGAHGLSDILVGDAGEWWDTATLYALTHSVAMIAIGLNKARAELLRGPALAFFIGILVFAGTLYSMALGAPRWLGAFTPIGGTSLLIAWAWLAFEGYRSRL